MFSINNQLFLCIEHAGRMEKQKNNTGRVIVTSGRTLMALSISHSLGQRGIEIIGVESVKANMLYFSKYVQFNEICANPLDDPDQFLDDLEYIILKYKPANNIPYLLMPSYEEIILISKHKARFDPHITVACPDYHLMNQVTPKQNLALTAKALNVNIPDTYQPKNLNELIDIAQKIEFPALIKPPDLSGGRGIKKVKNKGELLNAYHVHQKKLGTTALVQSMAKGEEYCLTTLYHKGVLKASMAYKNVQRFPTDSGSAVVRETIDESPFVEEANKLLSGIQWHGIAELDFMWTGNPGDKPVLIEVNPRFWAALFQSIQSGVDFPWLTYLLFTNNNIPPTGKKTLGLKTKTPVIWAFSAIQDSVHFDRHFNEIRDAGKQAIREMRMGRVWEGFSVFVKLLWQSIKRGDESKDFFELIKDSGVAENEIFSSDDPFVAMGVLYILAYLVKYKKLPPEAGF